MVNSVVIRDYVQALNVSSGLLLRMASKDIIIRKNATPAKITKRLLQLVRPKGGALSRARSAAPWVTKFGNLCIQEISVLRKSSVWGTSVLRFTPSCKPG